MSCGASKDFSKQKLKLASGSFYVPSGCDVMPSEGIDGETGTIVCATDTFVYDCSRTAYEGPKSLYDEFNQSFKRFHHRRFFPKLHVDEKVWPYFVDSVRVVEINHISEPNGALMFSCDGCNAVATLQYKGNNYEFPYQVDQSLVGSRRVLNFFYDQEGEMYRKIYLSKSSLKKSGLYLRPIDFDVNDLTAKTLSVSTKHIGLPSQQTHSILKRIKLK